MAAHAAPTTPLPLGSVSTSVKIENPATPLVATAYCYSYGIPRVEWGDNTLYESMTLTTPGTGGLPNLYTKAHTYVNPGTVQIEIFDQVKERHKLIVGGPYPWYDPDKRRKTIPERQQEMLTQIDAMRQVKDEIGPPDNSVGPYTVKTPGRGGRQ
jgi:hypothetical protein